MSKNKMLLNHGVITRGGARGRVVLDHESGLVYSYSEPEKVLALYCAGKGWITPKTPYYSSGGWGRGSNGDAEGHYAVSHTKELLRAIGARVFEAPHESELLSPAEISARNEAIKAHNKSVLALKKRSEKAGLSVETLELVQPLKLREITSVYGGKEKGVTARGLDPIAIAKRVEGALETFINGKGKRVSVDDYFITANVVTQRTVNGSVVVAFRDAAGTVFLNSQVISLTRFEREFMGGQSLVQSRLRKIARYSIPFNVLASAGLALKETKVIEQGPESTHRLAGSSERHFTGALLLENSGRKFLMDIDRLEISHGIFNAFFVEVASTVGSIAEAYDSMKPQAVKDAEEAGVEVKRQGEWFFIDTGRDITVPYERVFSWDRDETEKAAGLCVVRSQIAHGKGRPNTLYKPFGLDVVGDDLVCGVVSHTGREHKDLDLGSKVTMKNEDRNGYSYEKKDKVTYRLWRVVPNTTVGNFTITGDVD